MHFVHLAGLGHVVFTVKGEQDEFPEYHFELPTVNDQVLLVLRNSWTCIDPASGLGL